jgi:hypothetical protein
MTVAPLRIETDRYERLEVNEQLCFNCSKLGIKLLKMKNMFCCNAQVMQIYVKVFFTIYVN